MPGTGYLVPKATDLEELCTTVIALHWIKTRVKDVAEAKDTSLLALVARSFISGSRKLHGLVSSALCTGCSMFMNVRLHSGRVLPFPPPGAAQCSREATAAQGAVCRNEILQYKNCLHAPATRVLYSITRVASQLRTEVSSQLPA